MAMSVSIQTRENAAKIVVDGNEIHDVLSYSLIEGPDGARLVVEILITGEIEAQR